MLREDLLSMETRVMMRGCLAAAAQWMMVVLIAVLGPGEALAQECESEWLPGMGGIAGVLGNVHVSIIWDPDGDGPAEKMLVVGGEFVVAGDAVANRIAAWDGERWHALGAGLPNTVYALASWDPDGTGPQASLLISGGVFSFVADGREGQVSAWDGATWRALGMGMRSSVQGYDAEIRALASWDPDGPGPLGARLFAGGTFNSADGEPAQNIAQWDGNSWRAVNSGLLSGLGFGVNCMTTWSSSSDDANNSILVIGGLFSINGTSLIRNLVGWNGTDWIPMGNPNTFVRTLSAWDPDGLGEQEPLLIAAGDFGRIDGLLANRIAAWDGSSWQPLGEGLDDRLHSVTAWDADGDGPAPSLLVAGGRLSLDYPNFTDRIAAWNGSSWQTIASGLQGDVYSLAAWCANNKSTSTQQLIVGGECCFPLAQTCHLASWDGSEWNGIGSGTSISGTVDSITRWDPDGPGAQAPLVVAGGRFSSVEGTDANNIAAWSGTGWEPLGRGINADFPGTGQVRALTTWDSDGVGPVQPWLIAGGEFWTAGDVEVGGIAAWDGSAWRAIGVGSFGRSSQGIYALTTWDPDDNGPSNALLIRGGDSVQAWNGTTWTTLSQGSQSFRDVLALDTWDPDGNGPARSLLIAGGSFHGLLMAWNGVSWQPLSGLNNIVKALGTWDPDGAGPLQELLVAGGYFSTAGELPVRRVAAWNGTAWQTFPGEIGNTIFAVHSWDPDGVGPDSPLLIAGGEYLSEPSRNLAAWDGDSWEILNTSPYGEVTVIESIDIDGPGLAPSRLFVGGRFSVMGGFAAGAIAQYGRTSALMGDADYNGVVDMGDIAAVMNNWLAVYTETNGLGDGNFDGVVSFGDLASVLANWQSVCE